MGGPAYRQFTGWDISLFGNRVMGRLFWKFFLFCWLMQVIAAVSVGMMFHYSRHHNPPGPHGIWQPPPPHVAGDAHLQHLRPPTGPHHPPPPRGPIPPEPMIAGLIVSLLGAWLMAWYFSKPIKQLRRAFVAAAEGDMDSKLEPVMGQRKDELADLGRDFDFMTKRIQSLIESQRRLLHYVSHELRSPLARLQVAIGLAQQKPENLAESLARIELESQRMENLVGELLTLSRLTAGSVGPRETVHMHELIELLVSDAQFEAQARDIKVIQVGNMEALVDGNPAFLTRAIENVVRNAIKHSPEHGVVKVQTEVRPAQGKQELILMICDQGKGVEECHLETIFEPFFRTENQDKSASQGYGLGLALAKRVITAHGGQIRAFILVGGGLCVEICLPAQSVSGSNA